MKHKMKDSLHLSSSPTLPALSSSSPRATSLSWLPYMVTLLVILLCFTSVQARWCTRMVTYETVRPYVVKTVCNQSYQEACSFWSYEMCTQYEQVECMKEYNKTVVQYKVIEVCCPGFKLNPVNKVTCISTGNGNERQEKVTPRKTYKPSVTQFPPLLTEGNTNSITEDHTSSGSLNTPAGPDSESKETDIAKKKTEDADGNQNRSHKTLAKEGHDGKVEFYESSNKSNFLGLSNGVIAGIVSAMLFLLVVIILVSVRIHKRRRNAKLKAQAQSLELDASQNMISKSDSHA